MIGWLTRRIARAVRDEVVEGLAEALGREVYKNHDHVAEIRDLHDRCDRLSEQLDVAQGASRETLEMALKHITASPFSLRKLQVEHGEWAVRNFGAGATPEEERERSVWAFLGMVEEAGELAHALLKQRQGIRGAADEHEAKAQDAFGDLLIFAVDFARRRGWDAEAVVAETWAGVKKRDWLRNKMTGQVDQEVA